MGSLRSLRKKHRAVPAPPQEPVVSEVRGQILTAIGEEALAMVNHEGLNRKKLSLHYWTAVTCTLVSATALFMTLVAQTSYNPQFPRVVLIFMMVFFCVTLLCSFLWSSRARLYLNRFNHEVEEAKRLLTKNGIRWGL